MEPAWADATVGLIGWGIAAAAVVLACRRRDALARAGLALVRRLDPRRPAPVPAGRPLEQVAGDVRRIGQRFNGPQAGLRYAKYEGLRRAYDKVLAEACAALGIEHLLTVLSPGDELDRERVRVERRLEAAGVRLTHTDV